MFEKPVYELDQTTHGKKDQALKCFKDDKHRPTCIVFKCVQRFNGWNFNNLERICCRTEATDNQNKHC